MIRMLSLLANPRCSQLSSSKRQRICSLKPDLSGSVRSRVMSVCVCRRPLWASSQGRAHWCWRHLQAAPMSSATLTGWSSLRASRMSLTAWSGQAEARAFTAHSLLCRCSLHKVGNWNGEVLFMTFHTDEDFRDSWPGTRSRLHSFHQIKPQISCLQWDIRGEIEYQA